MVVNTKYALQAERIDGELAEGLLVSRQKYIPTTAGIIVYPENKNPYIVTVFDELVSPLRMISAVPAGLQNIVEEIVNENAQSGIRKFTTWFEYK